MSDIITLDGMNFTLNKEGETVFLSRVEADGTHVQIGGFFVGVIPEPEPINYFVPDETAAAAADEVVDHASIAYASETPQS